MKNIGLLRNVALVLGCGLILGHSATAGQASATVVVSLSVYAPTTCSVDVSQESPVAVCLRNGVPVSEVFVLRTAKQVLSPGAKPRMVIDF